MMCVDKTEAHFFGIGDWGGDAANGHTWENPGKANQRGGKVDGVDDWAQQYVARQMRSRAAKVDPDFVLNAGDNFYPGGIDAACMQSSSAFDPTGQFHNCFDTLYNGALTGKPWLSVLGNHDYGGRSFGQGWDYQILHTWHSNAWRMPAQFWSQTIQYTGFSVDVFMLDSNFMDALPVGSDPNHNICQVRDGSADYCWGISLDNCVSELNSVWRQGLEMLESRLATSTATWKIIVSHFPGPAITGNSKIKELNTKYGIDLVFTGHTHYQYASSTDKDIPYIISGGGGGVTSDCKPSTDGHDGCYGFVDFTITRDALTYDMHSWGGFNGEEIVMSSRTIHKALGNLTMGEAMFV